ncbi:MAG: hypothetical protein M3R55_17435 [Acidobacteriota bacterium]|nr:hypothetical protein [Acidobacteriota bacterium]
MAGRGLNRTTILLILLAILAVAVLMAIWPDGAADTTGSTGARPRDAAGVAEADPAVPPSLGLEQMTAAQPAPSNRRDLFRFGSVAPARVEGLEGQPGDGVPARPAGGRRSVQAPLPQLVQPMEPAGPPPTAPIPLRYVGYLESPQTGRLAALSDGRYVYHGREGQVIEGQWRIVKIGVESVVIERADGTGRQTLRLTGG